MTCDVAVIPDGGDDFLDAARASGLTALRLPKDGPFPGRAALRLRSLIRGRRYDVLLTHDVKSNFAGHMAVRGMRCRHVVLFHGRTSSDAKMRFYERIDDHVLRSAAAVVAVSDATRHGLERFAPRVATIRNALAPEQIPGDGRLDLRAEWGIAQDDVLFLCAGRLSLEKGHAMLLEAFEIVAKQEPRARLVVAGDGPLRAGLEHDARRRGLEGRARFVGFVSDVRSMWTAADVAVLPSRSEGLPMVLLEAAWFEKPCVATDVGGVTEFVENEGTGLVVPPRAPDALAAAMVRLARHAALRQAMGRRARERCEREFSAERYASEFGDLFDRVGGRGRGLAWVTWERHRRTREIADALGADLVELEASGPRWAKHPWLALRTITALVARRPRVVIVQCPSIALAALASALQTVLRYRLVIDAHNAAVEIQANTHPARAARWIPALHHGADLTIVTNEGLARIVEANGGKPFVLPDRIPRFDVRDIPGASDGPPRGPGGEAGGEATVVFVCTYAPDEPVVEVIEAARILGSAVTLHVTGNARKAPPGLVALAPDNVRFTGFLPEDAYVALLARADAIVDLTTRENCLVCGGYEAVALRVPLVTSDTKALRAHFSAGTTYAAPDRASLAEAIRQALGGGAALRREMRILKHVLEAEWAARLRELNARLDLMDPVAASPVSHVSRSRP